MQGILAAAAEHPTNVHTQGTHASTPPMTLERGIAPAVPQLATSEVGVMTSARVQVGLPCQQCQKPEARWVSAGGCCL